MLGRFFAGNWRPPADEIRFAADNGFAAIQVRCDLPGGIAHVLRENPTRTGRAFADAGVECVVEMLQRFHEPVTVAEALAANLPALLALGARRVHIHPVPGASHVDARELEDRFPDEFADACALAEREGLTLGVEHNSHEHRLLIDPAVVADLLAAVPSLSFVWDTNHAAPDGFVELLPRASLVHVSDTPLPETNHHLPLGRGNVDFTVLRQVDVPLILEIGGLPVSGGPGLDTDEALLDSKKLLTRAVSDTGTVSDTSSA
jgi:L-ribulose-5-phosphate 3-epimerase